MHHQGVMLSSCAERFVLVAGGDRLALVRPRRVDSLLARLFRRSLDARLASGAAAESDRLLAVRARQLVGRSNRLAARWRCVAGDAPDSAELWQVVDLLGSGAAPARVVAAARTVLPVVARAGRGSSGRDVVAAAVRATLGGA